jgi:hypothetical protein
MFVNDKLAIVHSGPPPELNGVLQMKNKTNK